VDEENRRAVWLVVVAAAGRSGGGGGGSLRRLIVGVAVVGAGLLAQPAAGQGLEELRVRYPEVKCV
jgi:hypothetical protein